MINRLIILVILFFISAYFFQFELEQDDIDYLYADVDNLWEIVYEMQREMDNMTEEIDEGPIVLQEEIMFSKSDKYQDVRVKVYKAGLKLLAKSIDFLNSGTLEIAKVTRQGEGNYYKVIDKEKLDQVIQKLSNGVYEYQE